MIRKFLTWSICFGLSFGVESIGIEQQPKAFLIIFAVQQFLTVAYYGYVDLFLVTEREVKKELSIGIAKEIAKIIILLGIASIASVIFNCDFCIAYQMVTLGQCVAINDDYSESYYYDNQEEDEESKDDDDETDEQDDDRKNENK